MAYEKPSHRAKGNRLLRSPIRQQWWDDTVCHQRDLGVLPEVIPPTQIEHLLEIEKNANPH